MSMATRTTRVSDRRELDLSLIMLGVDEKHISNPRKRLLNCQSSEAGPLAESKRMNHRTSMLVALDKL